MTTRPLLALAAMMIAAPMAAQNPTPPAAPRGAVERPKMPELTAEQRTKLRAIEDNQRAARRALEDQRIAAERKHEDALRAVLTPEQFQAMHARKAMKGKRGQGRGPAAVGRRGGTIGGAPRGAGMAAPGAPIAPRAVRGRPAGPPPVQGPPSEG